MKKFANLLAAAALVFSMSTSAFAQVMESGSETTTIQTTTNVNESTTLDRPSVNSSTTTITSVGIVQNDPAVIAALAALNATYSRYDMLIMGILNHSQQVDYAAMEKHADWFMENPLTQDEVHGYLAYMSQRLHLDADQEREAARIEGHFLAEIGPLYTAYHNALQSAYAARRTSISTIQVTEPVIAAPSVETTTTVETTTPQVQVREETTTPPTRFIRNTDMK